MTDIFGEFIVYQIYPVKRFGAQSFFVLYRTSYKRNISNLSEYFSLNVEYLIYAFAPC